jgi:hypothetical protein
MDGIQMPKYPASHPRVIRSSLLRDTFVVMEGALCTEPTVQDHPDGSGA